ncbi:retrovirus-related Pol polyprotein from transposon RE1 [Trichonephila clavata]|uniref:Retrovirus-related Pol polyprotein from transposon RE1 n=1 Tax=Trichonephila clavata TaxID=2740835 RepID=A0A8X6HRI0_TRICU|nr:retrovirus-related Pol polyprotein from transposon RE1 [Trichonephila clavata]
MKQELEKTETVYFSNFLSKKKLSKVPRNVNTVPGGTTATPADPSGKTEYQKRDVSKTSTETPTTSFEKPDLSSDNRSLIPCSEVKWIRNIGREVTGSNVYYGIEVTATRLRSFNEMERYCNKSNIQYDPSLFDFRKEDTESQEVNTVEVDIPVINRQ